MKWMKTFVLQGKTNIQPFSTVIDWGSLITILTKMVHDQISGLI